jgi:FkbM family methyltransferase
MKLNEIKLLRRLILPLLSKLNLGDITIRHHYTGQRIRLHAFHHKAYWYHGRAREKESMGLFAQIVSQGDTVIEVGGHIGYISLYFRQLAGKGRVVVFEPGKNNLPYIRQNTAGRQIELVEKAAGDRNGEVSFYLDTLSGQNNSLVKGFEGLLNNQRNSFVVSEIPQEVKVEMVRLDDFVRAEMEGVSFVKIDVEGAELNVLMGMQDILTVQKPCLMVEIQANESAILAFLEQKGYGLFDAGLRQLYRPEELKDNVFCLHREAHRELAAKLGARFS